MPGSWKESLDSIRGWLSPLEWETFSRLHRNFVGYRSNDTLNRFYGFVFSQNLQNEINRPRFGRLSGVLQILLEEIPPGLSILDIGAGSGLIATLLKRGRSPSPYVVQDICKEARQFLSLQGFDVLTEPVPRVPAQKFDRIISVDSLGEVNADEDEFLSEASSLTEIEYSIMMEERYGLGLKLEGWKSYLKPNGRFFFWEPFKHARAWKTLENLLISSGWKVQLRCESTRQAYLELTLP